jgi:hypothetical protein
VRANEASPASGIGDSKYESFFDGLPDWVLFAAIGAFGGVLVILALILVCLFIKKKKQSSVKNSTPKVDLSENVYYGSGNNINEGRSFSGRALNNHGIVAMQEQGRNLSNLSKDHIFNTDK